MYLLYTAPSAGSGATSMIPAAGCMTIAATVATKTSCRLTRGGRQTDLTLGPAKERAG